MRRAFYYVRMRDNKTRSRYGRVQLENRNFPPQGNAGKFSNYEREATGSIATARSRCARRVYDNETFRIRSVIPWYYLCHHREHPHTDTQPYNQTDRYTLYTRALLIYTFTTRTMWTDTPQQRLLFFRNTRFLHSPARESVYEHTRCRYTRRLYSERHQPKNKATFNLRA